MPLVVFGNTYDGLDAISGGATGNGGGTICFVIGVNEFLILFTATFDELNAEYMLDGAVEYKLGANVFKGGTNVDGV